MIFLSVLSFLASAVSFYIGFLTMKTNRKSEIYKLAILIALSMTIWSFGEGFVYLAENVRQYSFWNKFAAFGWCTFEAFILYFTMLLTGNKMIRYRFVKVLIILPAMIFLFMVLFVFGPGKETSQGIETLFFIGNFIYNQTYISVSIFLVFLWGRKSKSRIQKKQANIVVIFSLIPLIFSLLFQYILPRFTIWNLPNISQIFTVITILGVNYAVTRYQFLSIPSKMIINKLFNELSSLTFLVGTNGNVIMANQQVYSLLGYTKDEVIGNQISSIMKNEEIEKVIKECETLKEPIRFQNIMVPLKNGTFIPFQITVNPLYAKTDLLQGILILGEDIRATKLLENEIANHKITNEKLRNSEMLLTENYERISKLNQELMAMNDILINKSVKDGLTNLYNHQYMNEILETLVREISETNKSLCVMMLDIDHFKQVNDRFGHQVGDIVLVTVADLIMSNTRKYDSIGRYGGEEFIVALPETELDTALRIAERIRLSIQEHDFGIEGLKVTISAGVVQYEGENMNTLVHRADMLLYQAKNSGRNKVAL